MQETKDEGLRKYGTLFREKHTCQRHREKTLGAGRV